jgi:hypothetical protein
MKISSLVLILILVCGGVKAQNKEMMSNYQNDINDLFIQVFSTENKDNERYNANEQVMNIMEEALLQPKSFKWDWKLNKAVSVLTSDDDKFRVFTWTVLNDWGEHECFGYMQVYNENADVYEICALRDKSEEIFNPEEVVLSDNAWYGMVYTHLITTKYEGKYFYTLIGWNGGNSIVQRKVIEPVSFKRNSTRPTFGSLMFRNGKNGNKNLRRIIFRYAKDVNINVQYDEQYIVSMERIKVKKDKRTVTQEIDRENKAQMIVFDQVGPRVPGMEGMYQYYVPTGQESGYSFEKGRWVLKQNVRCRLEENKKRDEAKPLKKKNPRYMVNKSVQEKE